MNEKEIIKKIISGEKELFALLLRKYEKLVNNIIYSMVFDIEMTKDLTQEAFIKSYENLNSFNDSYEFKWWITKIARNHTIDYIRKRKINISLDELDPDTIKSEKTGNDERVEIKRIVEKALSELNEEERTLIILKYKEGFSNREIAFAMEISEKSVNVKIFRAKEKMKDIVNGMNKR